MNPMFIELLKQVIIAFAGISIIGATVATGTIGASNLVSSFTKNEHKIAQVQADNSENSNNEIANSPEGAVAVKITSPGTIKPTAPTIAKKTTLVITAPTTNPSPTKAPQPASGCIITLSGQQYDVTSLQQSHSGGNIFSCGTDMSSMYQGKHGSSLSRMQKYLVTSGGTNPSATGANTTGNNPPQSGATGTSGTSTVSSRDSEHESEHESREHEMEKVLEAAKKELENEDD